MAYKDQEHDQLFYADEFGEQIQRSNDEGDEAIIQEEETMMADDSSTDGTMAYEDSFHETLESEHIGDQLNDPNLQSESEKDMGSADKSEEGFGEKIKDFFSKDDSQSR